MVQVRESESAQNNVADIGKQSTLRKSFEFADVFPLLKLTCLPVSYCSNPVLVIIDVQPKELGIPSQAYCTVEEVKEVRRKQSVE